MLINVGAQHFSYPFSAVCEVVASFPDGVSLQGSGVMVSANDVLTASHVIYSKAHGGAATSVVVYPGSDGASHPFGHSLEEQGPREWDAIGQCAPIWPELL